MDAGDVVGLASRGQVGRDPKVVGAAAVGLEAGIGFGVNLDHYGAVLIGPLDGGGPLRPRVPEIARGLGAPEPELEAFAERLARHLVEHGLAVPA